MQARDMTRAAVVALSALALAGPAAAQSPTALDVMKRSEDIQEKAIDRQATMKMTLVNKRGDKRERTVVTFMKRYPEAGDDLDNKSIMFFLEPADVKGTGFLQFGHKDEDDDQWLYLPALRKVRKITSSSKNSSFMGTEFTYDDMSTSDVEDDEHTLLEESAQGWKIESKPRVPEDDDQYSKVVSWVRRSDYLPARADFYDTKGKLLKTLTTGDIRTINDIPTPHRMEMANHQNGARTILEFQDIVYDEGLGDDLFEKRQLEKGPPS